MGEHFSVKNAGPEIGLYFEQVAWLVQALIDSQALLSSHYRQADQPATADNCEADPDNEKRNELLKWWRDRLKIGRYPYDGGVPDAFLDSTFQVSNAKYGPMRVFTEPKTFEDYNTDGTFGPNDGACEALAIEAAANKIRRACTAVVGYSHSDCVSEDHPLVKTMKLLAETHREVVYMANKGHDPQIFGIPEDCFITPEEHWKPYQGEPGLPNGPQFIPERDTSGMRESGVPGPPNDCPPGP